MGNQCCVKDAHESAGIIFEEENGGNRHARAHLDTGKEGVDRNTRVGRNSLDAGGIDRTNRHPRYYTLFQSCGICP